MDPKLEDEASCVKHRFWVKSDFMKLPLSLVIITLNEEAHLARCIESVPFAQEIIVVDSLSKDKTREIALRLGAKVIEKPFMGYREQKQFALDQASCEWVLSLDADEVLSPALQAEILARFLNREDQADVDGYKMPRLSFYLGRWIRQGVGIPIIRRDCSREQRENGKGERSTSRSILMAKWEF